ncbi:MAG: FAD-dependent oxidoreductase [Actinomycetota bacterium]|nr:FAD-dependent oxidoreductase [Actinomycetota bacterium]
MEKSYDAVVIGAGIAGLGVAGLLQKAGKSVLCVEKDASPGGRMQGFDIEGGWRVDIGLHMVELGDKSSSALLVKELGKEVLWGRFSETVEVFKDGKWRNLLELVSLSQNDVEQVKGAMKEIASMDDREIEANDARSWADWLKSRVKSRVARDLFEVNGMIMTTVPEASSMAAGEILYIARENLRKKRDFLTAAYPKGGMLGIIEPLKAAFEEAGGELLISSEIDRVLFDGNEVEGVALKRRGASPYPESFYIGGKQVVKAPVVVCAVPLWSLDSIIDLGDESSLLPGWWLKRYKDLKYQTTGLIGYTIALKEPVYDKPNFLSALRLERTGMPFQAFVPSAFDPDVSPPGKSILQTDCVVEVKQVFDKFELNRLLDSMWEDIKELFPGIEKKIEWKFPYKCIGCDGLARKPANVGIFKPDVVAPGVRGLYFAGDTYRGRGLAVNSAAVSARLCAERILECGA